MSFKGQQVTLLAVWELYNWIRMRDTMTSLSERPLRSMGNGGGGGVDGVKTSGWRKTRDDEKKQDSSRVDVICVGKVWRERRQNRWEKLQKSERLWWSVREKESERETSWSQRLELCSPVVCTRWCSLIIHCMRWMSLSQHTALLHSALCLSAPGGKNGGGDSYRTAIRCMWVLRGFKTLTPPRTHTHMWTSPFMHVHLHRCMYRDQ